MRRLILMRHAKSSWADPGQRDLDRPLNKRGRRAARLLGGWLKGEGHAPDEALVSSARRARETWDGVVAAAGAAPTTYRPELYHASPEAMLAVLREPREAATLLVIAHQPGIGALARRLLADPPDADPVFDKFPTGATAVIDFDAAAWPDIGWQSGRLAGFAAPRSLER
jgi:phosphohistidine phosphatase